MMRLAFPISCNTPKESLRQEFNNVYYGRLEVLLQFYLWDKFHVTIVWNTRETGDIYENVSNPDL